MRSVALVALLLSAVLAGCADGADPTSTANDLVDEGEFANLQATSQTGVIRGVVVDEAIRPIAGATVSLPVGGLNRNTTTSDAGAFGFDGLEAGTYFLTVSKPGFKGVQQSTEVVAGDSQPPLLKVLLVMDPTTTPYFQVVTWTGYLECSLRIGVPGTTGVGVNACNDVGNQDVNYPLAPLDSVPDLLQAELIWDSTQTLGSGLSFVVGPPSCIDIKYARADGPSALVIRMNSTLIVEASEDNTDEGFDPETGLCYRVFSWTADEVANSAGLVTQQRFEAYFHAFYNMLPPEGWQFSVDGNPVPPT